MDELEINQTLLWNIVKFLEKNNKNGLQERELYFYPEHLGNLPLIPKGKVVKVTISFESQAKLENRPE